MNTNLYRALTLCASREAKERQVGVAMIARFGSVDRAVIPSLLKMYVEEPEPSVKVAWASALVSLGPEIVSPSLEMLDDVIPGAAASVQLLLDSLATERLNKLSGAAESLGNDAWGRLLQHWSSFAPIVRKLIRFHLDLTTGLAETMASLVISLRPVSLDVLREFAESEATRDELARLMVLIDRCGARGRRYIEMLFYSRNKDCSQSAAGLMVDRDWGFVRLMEMTVDAELSQRRTAFGAFASAPFGRVVEHLPYFFAGLADSDSEVSDSCCNIFSGILENEYRRLARAPKLLPSYEALTARLGLAADERDGASIAHGRISNDLSELEIVVALLLLRLRETRSDCAPIIEAVEFRLIAVQDEEVRESLQMLLRQLRKVSRTKRS